MSKDKVKCFAWLFSAEGYASIIKRCNGTYQPRVTVQMTDPEPVIELHQFFGGSLYAIKGKGERRDVLRWVVNNFAAGVTARQLLNNVVIPRKQHELKCVVDFASTYQIAYRGKNKAVPQYILDKRDEIYQQLKSCTDFNTDVSSIRYGDAELAWLFMGEGCAQIGRAIDKRYGCYRYCPEVNVQMMDYEPISCLYEHYGGRLQYIKRSNTFRWIVKGKRSGNVASKILPFVISPRKIGSLKAVIGCANTISDNRKYSDSIANNRAVFYSQCREYNTGKRGSNSGNIIAAYQRVNKQLELF